MVRRPCSCPGDRGPGVQGREWRDRAGRMWGVREWWTTCGHGLGKGL